MSASWTRRSGSGVLCQIRIGELSAPDTNKRKQPGLGFDLAPSRSKILPPLSYQYYQLV